MQQAGQRRRAPIAVLGIWLALSAGAGAVALIDFDFSVLDPVELYQVSYPDLENTGFTIRSVDSSPFTLIGRSTFDPFRGLLPDERVQEGFVLLDGTLSVEVSALKADQTRARTRTIYRMNVRRDSLRRENIARALVRQGVVRDITRARARARHMRLEDARVMRLVEREGRAARWIRAVRARMLPGRMVFRPRTRPDGVLGHFGTTKTGPDSAFVWAVMDTNSRYAVGLTVDRDNDGVPNASDNCIGTPNSNQANADGDPAGDACDLDDDNDAVADASDNCPLSANADQRDLDGDGTGDACDQDDDNDGVADGADACQTTAFGSVVDAKGCSIADQCPCASTWRNHGAYVRCVARTSELFTLAGLITTAQKDAIVSAAASSVCGF